MRSIVWGYGTLLVAKFAGFVLFMGLAALNKWAWLRREYVLIAVLSITAVMTAFYSLGVNDT
ncbi:MAG: hypothetical protein ABI145_08520 [Steroidobacteraceae bacterium]